MTSRLIFLDTETTGLKPEEGHRVVEIACLAVDDKKQEDVFHVYLNPERPLDEASYQIHGLSLDFLQKNGLLFREIKDQLLRFIENNTVIIHNAPFDLGFLNHELDLCQDKRRISDHCKIIDSLQVARRRPGSSGRNSLKALCVQYQVDDSERTKHNALLDTRLLAQVWFRMNNEQHDLRAENFLPSQQINIQNKDLRCKALSPEDKKRHDEFKDKYKLTE